MGSPVAVVNTRALSAHTSPDTDRADEQEVVLLRHLYKLLLAVSASHLVVTPIRYPLLTWDSAYRYEELAPFLVLSISTPSTLPTISRSAPSGYINSAKTIAESRTISATGSSSGISMVDMVALDLSRADV